MSRKKCYVTSAVQFAILPGQVDVPHVQFQLGVLANINTTVSVIATLACYLAS